MTAVADGFGLSRIGQIAMTVHDLPRAIAFYRDVLGLTFLFEAPPAMAFFDCGGVRLMMSLPEQAGTHARRQDKMLLLYTGDAVPAAVRWLLARRRPIPDAAHVAARRIP